MMEDQAVFIVKLEAKEIKSVTGSVKGRIQEYIRNMHRYPDAEFSLHRVEGEIKVSGVPEHVLKEALEAARSALLPGHKFAYRITREGTKEKPEISSVNAMPDDKASDERFAEWVRVAQKKWDEKAQAYDQEISRLQREIEKLEEDKRALRELSASSRSQLADLQARYHEISSLYEQVSARSVQSPAEAAKLWVSDWASVAYRIDEDIEKTGFSGKLKEIPELLNIDLEWLRSSVQRCLPDGMTVPATLPEIVALASVDAWEETDSYKGMVEDYKRALDENKYLDDLKEGKVVVPESLKEILIKAVDVEKNRKIILEYEAAQRDFKKRNAAKSEISALVAKYKMGEALRALSGRMIREKPLPVLSLCERDGAKWKLELCLPGSSRIVRESYLECVEKASEKVGLKAREDSSSENLVSIRFTLPGNVQSWKDASRIQEKLVSELANAFKGCPLNVLGVNMKITKVMEVLASKEKVELKIERGDSDRNLKVEEVVERAARQ